MRKFSTTVVASGEAGTATGEGFLTLHGVWPVYAIVLDYTGLPATTDVTVTDGGETVPSLELKQENSNTDKIYYPRAAASKAADGTASTLTEVAPVAESLKVTIAQGDPGGSVKVTAIVGV